METSGNRTALGVSTDIAQQVGARLRKARETIGRSTSTLSAKIKIREHYLIAIEEGSWNELPPGLNGRGLIRIYARELAVAVPELDQAANQTVMPAEHDAQAPYQINAQRKDVQAERDIPVVRVSVENGTVAAGPRPHEVVSRTNTLNPASRQTRGREAMTAPSARPVLQPTPAHRIIESSPDEEPLDVVTPDVASILGINLDTIDERPVVNSGQKHAQRREVTGTGYKHRPVPELVIPESDDDSPVVEKRPTSARVVENIKPDVPSAPSPAVEPEVAATPAVAVEPEVAATPAVAVEPEVAAAPTVAVEPEVAATPAVAVEPEVAAASTPAIESTVAADHTGVSTSPVNAVESSPALSEGATSDTSPGVSAAESYLKKNESVAVSATASPEQENQASGARGLWIAVGVMAACVLVLVGGRLMMRESPQEVTSDSSASTASSTTETVDAAQAVSPEASTPSVDRAVAAESQQTTQASATESQVAQSPSATVTESTTPPAINPGADVSTQQSPAETALTTAQVAPIEANPTPPSKPAVVAGAIAVLTLLEPIEIQVTADGQKVYSGRHEAGKVDIKFNKRAEIFVQDGSKAKLKYSGWEHGALGQPGRKRRIVLNAEAFSTGIP